MIIAIDARFWGLEHTGIGRYVMKLIEELCKLQTEHQFILFVRKKYFEEINQLIQTSKIHIKVVIVDAEHYSWREQLVLPWALYREKVELFHVPHFNFPILWFGALVITIHDLIKITFKGSDSTTKNRFIYWPKWIISSCLTWYAVLRAQKIITPSIATRDDIVRRWKVDTHKFVVTYEAPDAVFFEGALQERVEPFLIYTGNVYPHKNVPFLISAIKKYNETHPQQLMLKIVCGRSVFRARLMEILELQDMQEHVIFLGHIDDMSLRREYRISTAFISASLMEGFGLPGLEAMAAGTLVLSSHMPSMPEIYGEHAIYFDPHSQQSCINAIEQAVLCNDRRQRISRGIKHAKSFSWEQMARQTLETYSRCLI